MLSLNPNPNIHLNSIPLRTTLASDADASAATYGM